MHRRTKSHRLDLLRRKSANINIDAGAVTAQGEPRNMSGDEAVEKGGESPLDPRFQVALLVG